MNTTTTKEPRRILVIDDNLAIHEDFRKALPSDDGAASKLTSAKTALFGPSAQDQGIAAPRFELQSALQGEEGLDKLRAALHAGKPFNVAFVDMRMPPGWDGVQTIQRLWEADPNVQVVICTAYSDYSWEEISQTLGLTDRLLILKKPFDPVEVSQLAVSLSEKWALRQQAELRMDELESIVQRRTADLAHAALHDKLTGLPNRALLNDRLKQAIERKRRSPDYNFAVFFLDFDRFKTVNDSLGHDVGDELLKAIAQRLTQSLRATDSVCLPPSSTASRLGGDEFVVLADDLKDLRDVGLIAQRLLQMLGTPYVLKGHRICSTASIGVTTSAMAYDSAETMLRDADTAMYHAKAAGKARYVLFDQKMHDQVMARLQLEGELQSAIEHDEFVLHYQPIISLFTGELDGFEALLRWQHPTRGLIPPDAFIPCCEDTGLIIPMEEWVLSVALRQLKKWQEQYPAASRLLMAVNVSAQHLSKPSMISRIEQILRETGVSATSVILEITESVMIKNADVAIPLLEKLRGMGIRLHMDDFGTGYSSLSYLHRLPISGLKIDRSFVHSISERRDYAAVVQGIVTMARNLGLQLIAEGIETAEEVAMLQSMDCDLAQGYYFSRPMDAVAATAYLQNIEPGKPMMPLAGHSDG